MSRRCSWFMSQNFCTTRKKLLAQEQWWRIKSQDDLKLSKSSMNFGVQGRSDVVSSQVDKLDARLHTWVRDLISSRHPTRANWRAVSNDQKYFKFSFVWCQFDVPTFCVSALNVVITAKTIFESSTLFWTRTWEWFRAIKTNDRSLKQLDFRTRPMAVKA